MLSVRGLRNKKPFQPSQESEHPPPEIRRRTIPRNLSPFCRYLILHDLPAALDVPVGHDHAQLVHPGSLLPVLFENPDFQAAAEDNGGVACNKAVGQLNTEGTARFTERREIG